MASIPPAILALLVNISGYQLFLNPVHFPISPLLSSIIFTFAAYFIILQFEIYPLKLRRIPTVFIRTYEVKENSINLNVKNITKPFVDSFLYLLSFWSLDCAMYGSL